MTDTSFRRVAAWSAYAVALLSLLYAVVYLGLVRTAPGNAGPSALANSFIAISGVLATFVVVAVGDTVSGVAGRWLRLVGVAWALLSAAHGTFSTIEYMQGIGLPDTTVLPSGISATDPRGFATFGLAGLWSIVLGLAIRSGTAFPRALGTVALLNGIDLLLLFFATALGATTAVLITGGLAAVVFGPAQWVWLGRRLQA